MDSVLRAVVVYLIILVLFRVTGKRTLAQTTTMDFILLLIISEAAQQSLLGDDYSVTNGAVVITTLVLVDRVFDALKFRYTTVSRLTEGLPLVLVEHGRPLHERLRREHISTDDILASARKNQGLLRLEDIDFAVLERSGGMSIVPVADSARDQPREQRDLDEDPSQGERDGGHDGTRSAFGIRRDTFETPPSHDSRPPRKTPEDAAQCCGAHAMHEWADLTPHRSHSLPRDLNLIPINSPV